MLFFFDLVLLLLQPIIVRILAEKNRIWEKKGAGEFHQKTGKPGVRPPGNPPCLLVALSRITFQKGCIFLPPVLFSFF
jgi:hypothetical protein